MIKLVLFNPLQQEIKQKVTVNFDNVSYYNPSITFPYTPQPFRLYRRGIGDA